MSASFSSLILFWNFISCNISSLKFYTFYETYLVSFFIRDLFWEIYWVDAFCVTWWILNHTNSNLSFFGTKMKRFLQQFRKNIDLRPLLQWQFFSNKERKRKRYDSVLWQNPLYQQTILNNKSDNIKTPPKISITQWLLTDLGRSVGIKTVTKLVWLNRFTGSRPSHLPQKQCYQKDTHLKICK